MNTAKVTSMRTIKNEMRTLGQSIELILKRIESKNTAKNYKAFYNHFFSYIFDKHYMDTTWDELLEITYDDILEYVGILEVRNSETTIKTKLASLQSLMRELKKINPLIKPEVFEVKATTKKKVKKNEYGAFTEEEIYKLLDYAKNMNSSKAMEQYLFFKLSLATAHRLQSLLNLKWKDIKCVVEDGKNIWVVTVDDKTGYFETPISNELYSELRETFTGNEEDFVIKVSDKTLSKTLVQFCEDNNIAQKERNLVLHSIKKTSGDICYASLGGDIVKVAQHLKHSSIETCYRSYLNKNKKLSDSHSYNMFGKQEDVDSVLNTLSKEELINLIKSCNPSTVQEIMNKVK